MMFTTTAVTPELVLDAAAPGTEIRFRVRYVGKEPGGARFLATLVGRGAEGRGRLALPIDSVCAIVA